MKKKTKIIVGIVVVLLIIGVIQSLINPTETNTADKNASLPTAANDPTNPSSSSDNNTESAPKSDPTNEVSEPDEEIATTSEDDPPFVEKYDNEIVVSSKMLLNRFISDDDYDISLAPQLWTIADFDDAGAVMAITDITEKATSKSQKVVVVLTPEMDGDKMVGGTPHYISVGDEVFGNDGYCDEFFSNIEEFLNAQ